MARLAYHPEAFSRPTGKASKRVENPKYLDWIRTLPCIVTGRAPVEAAHISYREDRYGKLGRGLGSKESDQWAIPLCPEEHRRQHSMNEREFWRSVGIDPCIVAMALHAAFPNTERALLVIKHIERVPGLWPFGQIGRGGNSEGG
ncbi:MAG: hypothetical protein AB7I42_25145 [Bradyrhizobium sp.]|uniref:DUF968 domain-containing protein n=1 Tax=Bradyrhizobium sp. TaxID=376 RepID=UPI003D0B25F3